MGNPKIEVTGQGRQLHAMVYVKTVDSWEE